MIAIPTRFGCFVRLLHLLSLTFSISISFRTLRERSNASVHGGECHFWRRCLISRNHSDHRSSSRVIAKNQSTLRRNRLAYLPLWRLAIAHLLRKMCHTTVFCPIPRRITSKNSWAGYISLAGMVISNDFGLSLQRNPGLALISTTPCTNFVAALGRPRVKF